jgi:hypothetical protein
LVYRFFNPEVSNIKLASYATFIGTFIGFASVAVLNYLNRKLENKIQFELVEVERLTINSNIQIKQNSDGGLSYFIEYEDVSNSKLVNTYTSYSDREYDIVIHPIGRYSKPYTILSEYRCVDRDKLSFYFNVEDLEYRKKPVLDIHIQREYINTNQS